MLELMDSVPIERNPRNKEMALQIDDRDPGRVVDASRDLRIRFHLDYGRDYAMDASARRQAWLFQYDQGGIEVVAPYFESKFTYEYTNTFGDVRETDCTNIFLIPRDLAVTAYKDAHLRTGSHVPSSDDIERFLSNLEASLRILNEQRVKFAEKTLGKAVPVKVVLADIFTDAKSFTNDSSVIIGIALERLLDAEVGEC
jgi:hypothetical protein